MSMEKIAIATNNLSKVYESGKKSEVHALTDLNLRIEKSSIFD